MNPRRRGHFLIAALVIMGLIGTTLYLGTRSYHSLAIRAGQAQLDATAAQLVASARSWIDAHADRVAPLSPGDSISLDADAATTALQHAQLTITRPTDAPGLRIRARVTSGRYASQLTINITPDETES